MMNAVMTVGELRAAIDPALREILTDDERASTSIRVTDEDNPPRSLDDDEQLSPSTQLRIVTLGESASIWIDGTEPTSAVTDRVRSDLQDFVAESRFGWGELRP